MRRRSILLVFIIITGCCVLAGCGKNTESSHISKPVLIQYYYNAPCASCNEEEKIYAMMNAELSDIEIKYEIQLFNLVQSDSLAAYRTIRKELNIPDHLGYPLLVIGKFFAAGEIPIQQGLRDAVINATNDQEKLSPANQTEDQSDLFGSFALPDKEKPFFIYFYTSSCDDCENTSIYLNAIKNMNGEILRINIDEADNIKYLHRFFDEHQVPVEFQKVPIIFYAKGYLAGYSQISAQMGQILESDLALGFSYPGPQNSIEKYGSNIFSIAALGFVNGFNPCGLSMLFFLISLISVNVRQVVKYGILYLTGKIIAYCAIGVIIFMTFSLFNKQAVSRIEDFISIILLVAAIGLAFLNTYDFIQAKNGNVQKMLLKMPKMLRNNANNNIKKTMLRKNALLAGVLFLGIFLSLGEFMCTGQVFLLSIIMLARNNNYIDLSILMKFIVYSVAMIIPSIIFIFLVYKGKQLFVISDFISKRIPLIKLINAAIFILMATIIVLTRYV